MKIVETKAYELTDEEKVPEIKKWQSQEGLHLIKTFITEEKEKPKWQKDSFQYLVTNVDHVTIE